MAPGSPGAEPSIAAPSTVPILPSAKGCLAWPGVSWGCLPGHSPGWGLCPPPSASFPLSLPQSLRRGLQKTKEEALHQEQLLKEQEGELEALREKLGR